MTEKCLNCKHFYHEFTENGEIYGTCLEHDDDTYHEDDWCIDWTDEDEI